MSGKFGDLCSTTAPSSSVFDGRLARNLGLEGVTGKFRDPYSTNWDVCVHFDCSGSRKPGVAETSLPKGLFYHCFNYQRPILVFLSYVHSVWQAWNFQDILKSKTPFCVTSAGHRALFIRGRRGTF